MSGINVHSKEYIEENENKNPQRTVHRRRGRVVRGRDVLIPVLWARSQIKYICKYSCVNTTWPNCPKLAKWSLCELHRDNPKIKPIRQKLARSKGRVFGLSFLLFIRLVLSKLTSSQAPFLTPRPASHQKRGQTKQNKSIVARQFVLSAGT